MRPATTRVVEDNALGLELVRDVLQYAGYRVVEAATGEEGVRLTTEVRPDLVPMGLQLPGIDGSEALRLLRRSGPPPMPVVAVTAFAMDEDRLRVEPDGFDDCTGKPLRIRAARAGAPAARPGSTRSRAPTRPCWRWTTGRRTSGSRPETRSATGWS